MQQTPDRPKNVIPALRYDNSNSRGMNFIKFDGIEVRDGKTYLIDAKRNIPHWNKSAMKNLTKTFDRINEAKNQNPEIKVIYEFPDEKAKGHFDKWLENNKFYEDMIDEIRIRKQFIEREKMKEVERTIHLYRKVDVNESMEERHEKVMEGLSKLEAPLGLKDSEIPAVSDFGVEIRAHYRTKNSKTKGVSISGDYIWRDESSEKDGILWSMILK